MSEEKELKKKAAVIRAYGNLFKTPNGKIVLKDMLAAHFVLFPTFSPGDVYETIHREGERSVVLRILNKMKTNPNDILKHIDEIVETTDEDVY